MAPSNHEDLDIFDEKLNLLENSPRNQNEEKPAQNFANKPESASKRSEKTSNTKRNKICSVTPRPRKKTMLHKELQIDQNWAAHRLKRRQKLLKYLDILQRKFEEETGKNRQ